jgi:hypothetical protein
MFAMIPEVKDTVEIVSTFENPGQETIPQGASGRLCIINETDDIASVDFNDNGELFVVPMVLLKLKEKHPSNLKRDPEELLADWSNESVFGSNKAKLCPPATPVQEEAATVSENGSVRFNVGKPDISQVPTEAILAVAQGLSYGERSGKYSKHNWRKGAEWTQYYNSAMRHMFAWLNGEEVDQESSELHIDLALSNLAMLKYNIVNHPNLDDRYKGE